MSREKEIAISIRDIHKHFVLPQHKNTSLKQAAVNIVRKNNKTTQKVLDGVSFDIQKGDFFGIVGRNGSGKSTLLKLIAGVYAPTSGNIVVNGGLTPFIELGVGFNPELSGRDNVYLNGALLGYDRKQMDSMYDEIVDFAELGPFMDQKLKNYSSGMQVRLAFSIAIKAKNDILIFDEVLAVGDEAFQQKCLDVFENYKASRQTVVLVTHDMSVVRRFCTKAALLGEGKLLMSGDQKAVADYYTKINQRVVEKEENRLYELKQKTSRIIKIAEISHDTVKSGEKITVSAKLAEDISIEKIVVNLYKNSGEYVFGVAVPQRQLRKREFILSLSPRLGEGKYHFSLETYDNKGNLLEDIYSMPNFRVKGMSFTPNSKWGGILALDHSWQ